MNITKKNPTTGTITLDAAAFPGISQETIDREIRSFDPFIAAVERLYEFEHNSRRSTSTGDLYLQNALVSAT